MTGRIRLLVVERTPEAARAVARSLEREDGAFAVATATAADEALRRLDDGEFDAVVSDVDVPGADGLELLDAVRESHPSLPFVLFTGDGSEALASEAISAGVTDYVRKEDGASVPTEDGADRVATVADRVRDVVAGGRADGSVAGTERQFRKLIENARDVVYVVDAGGTFRYVSRSVEEVLGYAPDEVVGRNGFDLVHPEDRERAMTEFYAAVEDPDRRPAIEFRAQHADRSWRTLDVRGRNLLDDPDVEGFVVNARDVTERVAMARELEEQAGKIESLHAVAMDLESAETEQAVCDLAVGAAERILELELCYVGLVEDDVIVPVARSSGSSADHVQPMGVDEGLAGRTLRTGESDLRREITTDDGTEPARDDYRSGISVAVGDVGVFQAVSTEPAAFDEADLELVELLVSHVTEAIRRIRSAREIRRERDHFSALFENVPEPTIKYRLRDGEPYVLRVNPAFEDVFGYDAGTVEGDPIDEFIVPAGAESQATDLNEQVADGEYLDAEVTRTTADGRAREFRLINAPIPGEQTDSGYAMYLDITERKERERVLETLHSATRELMDAETKREMAEIASETADEILGLPINGIHLYDPDAGGLAPIAISETNRQVLGEPPTFSPGEGLAWQVFETGSAEIFADVLRETDRFNPETPIRSELLVPLGDHGVFIASSTEPDALDESDVALAQVLGANLETAFDRADREQELIARQQELEIYETVVETSPDPMYVLDSALEFVVVNQQFADLVGLPREEILGRPLSLLAERGLVDEATLAADRERIDALVSGDGGQTRYESTIEATSGELVVENNVALLPGGEEFTGLVNIIRDVTDRKERERTLETLHAATRELMEVATKEAVCEIAVRTADDVLDQHVAVVGLADVDDRVIRPTAATPEARDLVEGELPELDTESLAWETYESGKMQIYDDVREQPGVANPETEVRREIILPLGHHGIMSIVGTTPGPFDRLAVSLARILAANTEAALDRAEREEQLTVRTRELERQNERLESFANVVSHDLRNPLNVAEGRLELARETGDVEDFAAVERAHDRMNAIIDDVLTLARQGQAVGETATVELATVARNAWATVETGPASLAVEPSREIRADESRLHQLFENLFRNAVEHGSTSPPSQTQEDDVEHGSASSRSRAREDAVEHGAPGGRPSDDAVDDGVTGDRPASGGAALDPAGNDAGDDITVRVGVLDGGFYVEDTGSGIPADEREQVFESGYTTADEGTGFGLAIVDSIAGAHGWEVAVTESDEGGARFEITGVAVE